MKIVITSTILFTILIFSNAANAFLIDHGNFTTDNTSGLDWLDTAFTDGRSYNSVTSNPGFDWFGDGIHGELPHMLKRLIC